MTVVSCSSDIFGAVEEVKEKRFSHPEAKMLGKNPSSFAIFISALQDIQTRSFEFGKFDDTFKTLIMFIIIKNTLKFIIVEM